MRTVMVVFFCGGMIGCSGEEPPPPENPDSRAIRRPIERPVKQNRASAANPRPALQVEPEVVEVEKAGPKPETPVEPEAPATATATATAEAKENIPDREGERHVEAPIGEDGLYTVQPGDSLAVIAGREEVFEDPLKWPILFQLNRDRLHGVTMDERLPERSLPEGIRLRFSLEEKAGARTEPDGTENWVVNVISSPTADRIDGPAVRLMDEGLPVYISRATVKGQRWMRLRVGFFKDRDSAMKAGKEFQKILGQEDYWPVRIGPEETAEFAAYLK